MDAFWLGIKIAFGFAIGLWILREIFGLFRTSRFTRAGCTYQKGEKPGTPSGWLARDPRFDDWLLWDELHNVCLRMADSQASHHWDKQQ